MGDDKKTNLEWWNDQVEARSLERREIVVKALCTIIGDRSNLRSCVKCQELFWDDGNTFCPICDVFSLDKQIADGTRVHPDAPGRIRRLRHASQLKSALAALAQIADHADQLSTRDLSA